MHFSVLRGQMLRFSLQCRMGCFYDEESGPPFPFYSYWAQLVLVYTYDILVYTSIFLYFSSFLSLALIAGDFYNISAALSCQGLY